MKTATPATSHSGNPSTAIPVLASQNQERLRAIKVVRNDLRNGDFEVVPVSTESQAMAKSEPVPRENGEVRTRSDRRGWSALAARLFQAAGCLR